MTSSKAYERVPISLSSLERWIVYLLPIPLSLQMYAIPIGETTFLKLFLVASAVLAVVGGVNILLGRAGRFESNPIVTAAFLLFLVATFSIVGLAARGRIGAGLIDFLTVWGQIVIYGIAVVALSSVDWRPHHLRRLLISVLTVGTLIAAYAIYQAVARTLGLPFADLPWQGGAAGTFGTFVRPQATLNEPSELAGYLLTPFLVSLSLSTTRSPFIKMSVARVACAIISLGFLVTFSLGSYLAVAGAIIVFAVIERDWVSAVRVGVWSLAAAVVLSGLLYFIVDTWFLRMMLQRVGGFFDTVAGTTLVERGPHSGTSAPKRLYKTLASLEVWLDNPVFGAGLGGMEDAYRTSIAGQANSGFIEWLGERSGIGLRKLERVYGVSDVKGGHSALVRGLADMGVVGAFGIIGLIVLPIKAMKACKDRIPEYSPYSALVGMVMFLLMARGCWLLIGDNYLRTYFWFDLFLCVVLLKAVKYGSVGESPAARARLPRSDGA